jgi:hypothetical protein
MKLGDNATPADRGSLMPPPEPGLSGLYMMIASHEHYLGSCGSRSWLSPGTQISRGSFVRTMVKGGQVKKLALLATEAKEQEAPRCV